MKQTPGPAERGDVERAAAYWNEHQTDTAAGRQRNFLSHPLVAAYMSLRAFGQIVGQLDVVVAELRNRTQPGDRILSVGCGTAEKEIAIARQLPDRTFVGIDIAGRTIERLRAQIESSGPANLELLLGDFNDLQLEPRRYRAVLGLGAIHHVENLESFWRACAKGLTADGCLLALEYVGPDRLQWTDAQIEHGDRVLRDVVPARNKVHHDHIERTPVAAMIAADPSEAVRSSELIGTCKDAGFRIEGLAGAGGALLQPVLMDQIATFDPLDWGDNLVLARLFQVEDELMKQGVLGDDFVGLVARPPAG